MPLLPWPTSSRSNNIRISIITNSRDINLPRHSRILINTHILTLTLTLTRILRSQPTIRRIMLNIRTLAHFLISNTPNPNRTMIRSRTHSQFNTVPIRRPRRIHTLSLTISNPLRKQEDPRRPQPRSPMTRLCKRHLFPCPK